MGTNTRAFNRVFDLAQRKLRNTFGMELAELPSRAGIDQNNNEEENEARKATGARKKGSFFFGMRFFDINRSLFFFS
jgi:hypothetical protein